jgi:excisionase family DNA binding protein
VSVREARSAVTITPRLLSPDAVAGYLGLGSRWSVYRLLKAGELPAVTIAGKLRIDREDLARQAFPASSCTISGGRPSGTSSEPPSRSRRRWS